MQRSNRKNFFTSMPLVIFATIILSACGRDSSPEGRMSMKLEDLHKEMIDSLQQQNRAILDSLGKIREQIRELKQTRK